MNLVTLDDEENTQHVEPSSTREAHIEILEQRNADLSNQLDTLLSQQEDLDRSHMLKSRQLEHQIQTMKHHVGSTANKLLEMQSKSSTIPRKTLTKDGMCCMKASLELEQLRIEFDHVSQLKTRKENKLDEVTRDLCTLKQQCENRTQEYQELQRVFQEQEVRVQELKNSVQQYMYQESVKSDVTMEQIEQDNNLHQELNRASSVPIEQVVYYLQRQEREDEEHQEQVESLMTSKQSLFDFVWQWLVFTVCLIISILKTILNGPSKAFTDIQ